VTEKTHVAYVLTWTESESGWGMRPDGVSLHLTQDDVKNYITAYWDRMPKEVPHEYSRNDSDSGKLAAISAKLFKQLKACENHSMRLWNQEYYKLRNDGDIKE